MLAFIKYDDQKAEGTTIVALDATAPIAALAASQAGDAKVNLALDTRGFRFGKVGDYLDASFLPGGAKYGDLPGILSLATGGKLWLAGETNESAAPVKSAFTAAGKSADLTLAGERASPEGAMLWLLER